MAERKLDLASQPSRVSFNQADSIDIHTGRSYHSHHHCRNSVHDHPSLSQTPAQTLGTPKGFGHTTLHRSGTPDFPVIPVRPPLKSTIIFGGVSRASFYCHPSSILEEKGSGLSIEEIQTEEPLIGQHDWRFYICFVCICLMIFMSDVSATALCTALPYVAQDLGLTATQTFWIPGAYLMSATIMQPLFMRLSLALGCKSLLLLGLVLFTAGNITSAIARNATTILLGRSLEGVGFGAISVLTSLTLSQIGCSAHLIGRSAQWYGRLASQASWLGIALGPIIGGATTQTIGWSNMFWIQAHISITCLIILTFLLRIPHAKFNSVLERLREVDYLGWFLLACSVAATMIPISMAGTSLLWSARETLLPLTFGFLGVAGWCLYNTYRIDPILPVSIFRNKSAWVSCLGSVAHGALLMALIYFLPFFFSEVLGKNSALTAGLSLAPWTFSTLIVGVLCASNTLQINLHWPIWVGWPLITGCFGLMVLLQASTPTNFWTPLGLVSGMTLGALAPSLHGAIESAASNDDETIHATSLYIFFVTLGRSAGVLVAASIFLNSRAMPEQNNFAHDFLSPSPLRNVWIAACVLAGLVSLLSTIFTADYRSTSLRGRGSRPSASPLPALKA